MIGKAIPSRQTSAVDLRGRRFDSVFSIEPESLVVIKERGHPLFQETALLDAREDLVASIMLDGVIHPLICRRNGDQIEVNDGRKRTAAAIEANRRLRVLGRPPVKVVVMLRGGEDRDLIGVAATSNALRWEDSPLVMAEQCRRMINHGSTIKDCATRFGKTVDTIENWMKLEDLHPDIRAMVRVGKLKYTVAMRLARLPRERQLPKLKKLLRAGPTNANAVRAVVNGHLERVAPPEKAQLRRLADELLKMKAFQRGESESDTFSFAEWVLGRISTDELLSCLHSATVSAAVKAVMVRR